jgi:hypothetical protein
MTNPSATARNNARIYYGEGINDFWWVPVRNATQHVGPFDGTIEQMLNGNNGLSFGCHINRVVTDNKDVFPHPVLYVNVIRSRCLIVDEMRGDNIPKSCVRYWHCYGRYVDMNDKLTKKEKEELVRDHPELAVRRFEFFPPKLTPYRPGPRHYVPHQQPRMPSGSLRRALDALLITPEMLKEMGYRV